MAGAMLSCDPFMELHLDAHQGDLSELFEVESFDDVGSLGSLVSSTCHTSSVEQARNQSIPWWREEKHDPVSYSRFHSTDALSADDEQALSRSASLASSQGNASQSLLGKPPVQHACGDWTRHEHSAMKPFATHGECDIHAAIERVLRMPRVQLQREPLPLGLQLDAAAVLAKLHECAGSVRAACMGHA